MVITLDWGEITLNETYKHFYNALNLPTVQLNISILVKVLWWGFVWDTVLDLCTTRHHRCGSIIRIPPPEKERESTIYSSSHRQVNIPVSKHHSNIKLEEMYRNLLTNLIGGGEGGTFLPCVVSFWFEIPPPASLFAIHFSIKANLLFTTK